MRSGSEERDAVQESLNTFQPRASRALSDEDAREIAHNLTGFFLVLADWAACGHDLSSTRVDVAGNSNNAAARKGGEPGTAA
jgi:hypothetical protein